MSDTATECDCRVFAVEHVECVLDELKHVSEEHEKRPRDELETVSLNDAVSSAAREWRCSSFVLASSRFSISVSCESKVRRPGYG